MALKRLSEHAYGRTASLDDNLKIFLEAAIGRSQSAEPRLDTADVDGRRMVYIAYEPEAKSGGLGGVLVEQSGAITAWFGTPLTAEQCEQFGSKRQDSTIYGLELSAGVLALALWCQQSFGNLHTRFGDNDSECCVRVELDTSRDHCLLFASDMNQSNLQRRGLLVPTEANINDFSSRGQDHPLLIQALNQTQIDAALLNEIIETCRPMGRPCYRGGVRVGGPLAEKEVSLHCSHKRGERR